MTNECYLGDISSINKLLSDSLLSVSGQDSDIVDYCSCSIADFSKNDKCKIITNGVILIFIGEQINKIEICDNIHTSIERFVSNHDNIENIGVGILSNIQNVHNQEVALNLIGNYLRLIFQM